MREDQLKRLEDVSERLAEVALRDADPDNWAANDVPLVDMTRDQRGDAHWCRKTAVQTLAVMNQLQRLIAAAKVPGTGGGAPSDEAELSPEEQIAKAERTASAMLERIGSKGVPAR